MGKDCSSICEYDCKLELDIQVVIVNVVVVVRSRPFVPPFILFFFSCCVMAGQKAADEPCRFVHPAVVTGPSFFDCCMCVAAYHHYHSSIAYCLLLPLTSHIFPAKLIFTLSFLFPFSSFFHSLFYLTHSLCLLHCTLQFHHDTSRFLLAAPGSELTRSTSSTTGCVSFRQPRSAHAAAGT